MLAFSLQRAIMAVVDLSMPATQNKVWVRGVLSCLRVMVALKRITPWSTIVTTDGRSITDLVDKSLLPWVNSVVAQLVWRNSTTYGVRRLLHPEMVDPDTPVEGKRLYREAWGLLMAWEGFVDVKRYQWLPFNRAVGFLYFLRVRN